MSLISREFKIPAAPRSVGRIPYGLALSWLRARVARAVPGAQVWARNSYLGGAFRPFRSDLDITLWLPQTPGAGAAQMLRRILVQTKRWFPALGEANVYCEDTFSRFIGYANPYELSRDPIANARAGGATESGPAGKSVYLLRMLESNAQVLSRGWPGNSKKWREHVLRVSLNPERLFVSAKPIRDILSFALSEVDQSALDDLNEYLSGGAGSEVAHLLFPHRFCYLEIPQGRLANPVLRRVFLGQAAWEIWGLYGQHALCEEPKKISDHLARLQKWLEQAGNEGERTARGIQQLMELVRPARVPSAPAN